MKSAIQLSKSQKIFASSCKSSLHHHGQYPVLRTWFGDLLRPLPENELLSNHTGKFQRPLNPFQ